jgi:penicillin-binding protein 1A
MLQRTSERGPSGHGTLFNPSGWGSLFTFRDANGNSFRIPMAGKTGTTQNWQDAWVVGHSPYFATAVWFGFDRPGTSLGLTLTGSTLAGPVWSNYMREIHMGLPFRDFVRPGTGIVNVTICTRSGLLRTADCTHGQATLPFLEGTQPVMFCDYHGNSRMRDFAIARLDPVSRFIDTSSALGNISLPVIRDEQLLREIQLSEQQATAQTAQMTPGGPRSIAPTRSPATPAGGGFNPLLDGLPPAALNLPTLPLPTLPEAVILEVSPLEALPEIQAVEETGVTVDGTASSSEPVGSPVGGAATETGFVISPPLFNPLID